MENNTSAGRHPENHELTLDMAKHIAMIQRTPIGLKVRQYFIDIEKQWRNEHTDKPCLYHHLNQTFNIKNAGHNQPAFLFKPKIHQI